MGKKRTKDGKLKENPVFQEQEDPEPTETQQPADQQTSEPSTSDAALRPVKKAKGKKLQRRGGGEETPKEATPAAPEPAAPEEEVEVSENLNRSVWFEVAEEEGEIDVEELRKVMKTVGEVEELKVLKPHLVQCTFTMMGAIRQVLLLHNKQAGQLPRLASNVTDARTRKCVVANLDARVKIDYPLPAHLRIHISSLPSKCDNAELRRCLSHYGKVAYIFRNPHKHYGFAAFTKKSSVDNAVSAEATIIRGTMISVKRYQQQAYDHFLLLHLPLTYLPFLNFLIEVIQNFSLKRDQRCFRLSWMQIL